MTTEVKLFKDSGSAGVRWGSLVTVLLGEWELVWENFEDDWQGSADAIVFMNNGSFDTFCRVGWSYGSCSGCDPYEDETEAKATTEIMKEASWFNRAEARALAELMLNSDATHGKAIHDAIMGVLNRS